MSRPQWLFVGAGCKQETTHCCHARALTLDAGSDAKLTHALECLHHSGHDCYVCIADFEYSVEEAREHVGTVYWA